MPDFINNRSNLLKDTLKTHLSDSHDAYFALAFIRQSGVNIIVPELTALIERGGTVSILFANDFGASEAEAIITLQEIGAQLKFFSKPSSSFHLKAYIMQKTNSGIAVIGSSNLSASGLTTGTEWSICLTSSEIDFPSIIAEFQHLWESEFAISVTQEVIENLQKQVHSEDLRAAIHEHDRYPIGGQALDPSNLVNDSRNYIVTRKPDNNYDWYFQIYDGELKKRSRNREFNLVVICDYQTPEQVIFSIPYSYLIENILISAHLDQKGRYLFGVNKRSYRFNWHNSVKMDGNKFIVQSIGQEHSS